MSDRLHAIFYNPFFLTDVHDAAACLQVVASWEVRCCELMGASKIGKGWKRMENDGKGQKRKQYEGGYQDFSRNARYFVCIESGPSTILHVLFVMNSMGPMEPDFVQEIPIQYVGGCDSVLHTDL